MIYLKRDSVYTPIIFQHPDLVNKKYYQIDDSIDFRRITTKDSFKLNLDITNIKRTRITYPRAKLYYNEILGGLVRTSGNIIAIVVLKNNVQYVIVNQSFATTYTSAFARLKKSVNDLGISSRTKLLLWDSSLIATTFQEFITPTMIDYIPQKQIELSNKFILNERSKYPLTIDIKDSEVKEFKVGDYIVVINNNDCAPIPSNTILIITNIDAYIYVTYNDRNWYLRKSNIRHATQEEINKELNLMWEIDEILNN